MDPKTTTTIPERLLRRFGEHYILVMMLITRLGGVVGGLLVLYYVELSLEMPDVTRLHFRWTGIVAVSLTVLLTLPIALWETQTLRLVLKKLRGGETIPPRESQAAGYEAVVFAGRHHKLEACLAPLTCVVPLLVVLRLKDDAGWTILVNVALTSLMVISMVLISTFLAVECFMKPVVRRLLDSGIAINYRSLPVGRLKRRFGLCFTVIILTTALMIGILARQRALDIMMDPTDQGAAVRSLVVHSTYITIVAVVVGLAYSALLTNSVASRLNALVVAMEGVSRGNLSERLRPTGNDEVDILARQFNEMVAQLDRDHGTIRELNCTLEEKVRLRTAQMETTVSRLKETQQQLTDYNRQLETAREEAESANRAKGDFLANISHELRTPLNGVLGMTDLLLETRLDDQQRRFAATVKNSGASLLRLLNDVLDYSKFEAGKLDLEHIEFNLRETIEPVVEAASFRCVEEPLEIALFIDPTIPETLCGDPGRLRQILANLVNNAVKFTEQGSVVVRVERRACESGRNIIEFSVRDTGIGIPRDRYDRLFQSFSQIDASTTRKYGGSGLGLAICKQLCTLMGGDIDFESREGAGSTFSFTLPLDIPKTVPNRPCGDTFTENWSQKWSQANVLVIDDNGLSRETLADQLASWGFQVEQAADLRDGLRCLNEARFANKSFQMVFVDSEMTGLKPREFAERVHVDLGLEDCRLMMMVPLGRSVKWSDVLANGYSHFLTKPVLLSTLFEAVAHVTAAGEAGGSGKSTSDHVRRDRRRKKRDRKVKTTFPGARILLAEDNEINQDVAFEVLQRAGFEALIVENGVDAARAVATQRVDLVLMDCQMPVMDGFAATHAIRGRECDGDAPYTGTLPIIALTANAQAGERERCLAVGMNDYLSKPVHPKKLIAAIEAALSGSDVKRIESAGSDCVPETSESAWEFGDDCVLTPDEPPASPVLQVLDFDALLERCQDDEEFSRRLLKKFDARIDDDIDRIAEAVRDRDPRRTTELAHALKGSAANISAESVRTLAGRLESLGRDGELDDAGDVVDGLLDEINRLRRDIAVVLSSVGVSVSETMMIPSELTKENVPCVS